MKKIRWDLMSMFIGIIALLLGAYAVIKAGGKGSIQIAVTMVVFFGTMGYLLYKFLWQPRSNIKRLQKTGIPGKAKIIEVQNTNISVNNNPQLKLTMELKNNAGEIYTTSCKHVVSRLKPVSFQPGKEVNVKIDPANEKNVIVD